jgi:hypothetical protein
MEQEKEGRESAPAETHVADPLSDGKVKEEDEDALEARCEPINLPMRRRDWPGSDSEGDENELGEEDGLDDGGDVTVDGPTPTLAACPSTTAAKSPWISVRLGDPPPWQVPLRTGRVH